MMNIYLITIPDEFVSYDCYDAYVIAAKTRQRVKEIAAQSAADEGADVWHENSRIELLATAVHHEEGIILGSFNAG